MASLPPRPGSPARSRGSHSPVRRGRPIAESSRRLVDRLDPPPRAQRAPAMDSYVAPASYERPPSAMDSYVAGPYERDSRPPPPMDSYSYDRRGEPYGRRADFERRDRGWPERRDRSRERLPPPRRSPEPYDRRALPPHMDMRDRSFDRYPPRRPLSPRPVDRFPRRNSRSPGFRRSRSPPRRRFSPPRSRGLSPRRSRSPPLSYPAKCIKLGNHSITTPRSPSPSRRSRLPPLRPRGDRSRSPPRPSPRRSPLPLRSVDDRTKGSEPPEPGLIIEDEPPRLSPPRAPHRPSTPTRPRTRTPPPALKPEPREPPLQPKLEQHPPPQKLEAPDPVPVDVKLEVKEEPQPAVPMQVDEEKPLLQNKVVPQEQILPSPDVKMRNVSPPRQPRNRGPPTRGAMYQPQTRPPGSPPRGPRGDRFRGRGSGGGGGRRGLPSQAASFHAGPSSYSPSAPPTPTIPVADPPLTPRIPVSAPAPEPEVPLPKLPPIPVWDSQDTERTEMQKAVKTSRDLRAILHTQYAGIEKAARRAVHELETATIELRAAEARRKVADVHLDKARAGVLGIEYVHSVALDPV